VNDEVKGKIVGLNREGLAPTDIKKALKLEEIDLPTKTICNVIDAVGFFSMKRQQQKLNLLPNLVKEKAS